MPERNGGDLPVATILAIIFALVGGVVVIVGTAGLSFEEYLKAMTVMIGLLGIGRGMAARKPN